MIPVKASPIILCTALYIIFIGNNLLIPLREGLDFVEAGRPFQSRNVQGMTLLLYETVLQKGSLKLSPEYFLCMVGSCHTYSLELNHL
jgi:hypothetical protein